MKNISNNQVTPASKPVMKNIQTRSATVCITKERTSKISQLNSNRSSSSSSDDSLSSTSSSDLSYTSSRSSSEESDNTLNVSFKKLSLSSNNFNTTTTKSKSIAATAINPEIIISSKSSEPSTITHPIMGPMSYFKTKRGGTNLCMNGFSYQKCKEMKNGIKWWCCKSRNKSVKCRIFLYTSFNQGDDDHSQYDFKKIVGDHNHQPDKDKLIIQKFKSDLKHMTQSPTVPPSIATFNELVANMKLGTSEMAQLPSYNSIRMSLWRAHNRNMPQLPTGINFPIPVEFSTTTDDEPFILLDHSYAKQTKRILMFSSKKQFKVMCESSSLYMDGTFAITPRLFKQTYIIQAHDIQSKNVLPVAWILLNDKKGSTYKILFKKIILLAKTRGYEFSPSNIMSDYESGIISTWKELLPQTKHDGCFFHYLQKIVKRMKKYGLWMHYLNDSNLYIWIKKMMAIPMLSATKMLEAFQLIEKKQWLAPGMINMVCVYNKAKRTNNYSESYNKTLKSTMPRRKPSIWQFSRALKMEETGFRIKMAQGGAGNSSVKLIKGSNVTVSEQITEQINEINHQLIKNKIDLLSALDKLRECVGTKYDNIIENAMDDPKFDKIYPVITNQNLLEELIRFIELSPKKIKGVGVANGEIFKKENGRQISGSHRYLGVLEEDGTYNIYKKFKGGPLDGQTWLILRVQDECYRMTKFILEYAKTMGDMPRIRDVEDYFTNKKILVCRDRIQIILNHCHDAVNIINKKTNIDYDVTILSTTTIHQEKEKPSLDKTTNTNSIQMSKQSQSSSDPVLLDDINKMKSSKRLAKPVVSNTISPQPESNTTKCGTPLVNRLRKRKITSSPITDVKNNRKPAKANSCGDPVSSITSKKRRRQ
ncbi:unnamed protein product [Rotaria sordida]|uniref:MULE transposase domain-containing protein n=1 Tax=Rotaria sordida TaxID=392033 RepID=A0A819XRM6_9BILA|nr:unnamed protein product [Rotaria sordida]